MTPRSRLLTITLCLGASLAAFIPVKQRLHSRAQASADEAPSDHDSSTPHAAKARSESGLIDGHADGPAYVFREEPGGRSFVAENFAYQMEVACHQDGITITPSGNEATLPAWSFSLAKPQVGQSLITAENGRVAYQHSPHQEEWFINSTKGVEHGMTLATAISSQDEPLIIEFAVDSSLKGEQAGSNHLVFNNEAGVPTLRYEQLFAFDAKGRDIPTALAWNEDRSTISWRVDHQGFDYPITIDPIIATFSQTLLPPTLSNGSFGDSIAIVGNFMAVGSPSLSRVYLYEKNAGTWEIFSRKNFLVSTASNGGAFGTQVLMPDLNTIIVSDITYDAPTSSGGTNDNQGAIFVFGRNVGGDNSWGLIKQFTITDPLLPNGKLADRLGTVMVCNGTTLAANAIPDAGSYDTAMKSIYLFEKDRGGIDNWGQVPNVRVESLGFASGFTYGHTFDLEGDLLVVGSSTENYQASSGSPIVQFQGAIYLYGRNQGGTNQWGLLPNGRRYAADGLFGDFFGRSVSISGDIIAVGADSVDLSASQADAGAVYRLSRNQGGTGAWGFLPGRITAADAAAGDGFGAFVELLGDVLAVRASGDDVAGTNNAGSVYLFERNLGGPNNFGTVSGGKFSIDNVSNIVKVNSPVFLSPGHLAFSTNPSTGNSSLSIVNLSGTTAPATLGPITFSPQGVVSFTPVAAGNYQLRTSTNLSTWSNQGAAQVGAANASLTWSAGAPTPGTKRFYRVESP